MNLIKSIFPNPKKDSDRLLGKFPEQLYPFNAEKFMLSDFQVKLQAESKFVAGRTTEIEVFICPRCEEMATYEQEHGLATECRKCNLKRQSFGNALYIWD